MNTRVLVVIVALSCVLTGCLHIKATRYEVTEKCDGSIDKGIEKLINEAM